MVSFCVIMKKISVSFSRVVMVAALGLLFSGHGVLLAQSRPSLSPECIKYLSFYQEDFKQKNDVSALANWRHAFAECPSNASQNMYIQGSTLYSRLIAKTSDASKREAIVDTLLMLQDLRMKNYPSKRSVALTNKGNYMVNYRGSDYKYLYDNLTPILTELQEKSSDRLLVNLMQSAVKLYGLGQVGQDEVIGTYSLVSGILERIPSFDASTAAEIEKASSVVGTLFAESKVASCDDLVNIYSPKLQANPSDVALASSVVRLLGSVEGCQSNALYLKAATTLHKKEPTSRSAYALYRLYSSMDGDMDAALSYLEEAVSLSETGSLDYERMSFEFAQAAYKAGERSKAYDAARAVASMGNGYSGKAYLLLGNLWASVTASKEVDKYARFWVASDYYRKAKEVDSSLKDEADAQLASVSRYYPEASEMFMFDLSAGQGYDISCGGMSAHTTVRTRR